MVMEMYKLWGQRRGYKVTVVDEMPGEIAGIKVHNLTILLFVLSPVTSSTSLVLRKCSRKQCTYRILLITFHVSPRQPLKIY